LVVATGSISDLNGPMVFVGETEGVAGAYRPLSKIYQGSAAPTISVGSHGSVIDGTPFYATGNKTLYILSKDGNSDIDLTGNIEGNTISGVTINNLTGSTAYIANVSGSFTGSGIGLYDIPASGITGLELNRISDGSATASISQANGLRVNTNTEITGALIVTGNITGSNLYLSGNANIDGNITLGGNITIGDATTDIINFGGEVSSSIVPDVHNAFDLGSSTKNWRNLHISGTAYVDILQARQVNFTDLGILEDLTVSGSTYLGNGGDVLVVSGSAYYDTLTDNRIVIVGTNGLLEDDGQGDFEVDTDGDIRTSGSLTINKIYGKTTSNNSLHLNGGDLGAPDVELESAGQISLFSEGVGSNFAINMTGSVNMANNLGVTGSLTVSGATTLQNTLTVNSTTELKSAVGMNSTLDVTGSAQFKDTINVDGEATLASATVEDLTQHRIVTVGSGGSLIDSSGFTYNGTVFKIGNGQFEVDTNDGDVRTSGSLTVEGGQTINGDVTVNGVLTVTGNTQLQSNLYISGNLEVLGSATNVTIQSTTIELDDNIIRLNAYSPFERYAGFEVIDSGSSGVSASMVWDSLNDYWMFVSSSGQSSKMIGTTAGTYGTETSLTSTYFPIATGPNTIGDSLLRYSGTTLSFNTNKFTIDSGTGDTLVSGNFTLSYSGGTDNGNNTSAIMFRNSSNVVGFVTTTETTDVLDGILGYKNSDGALVFSTVIDGGGY
jgi:cytoskeletal protein CcmA (bactofilin family)